MRNALVAGAIALLAVSCGPTREEPGSADVAGAIRSVYPSEVTMKIIGASPKQEAVLREILAGLGPSSLVSVEVVNDVEKDWGAPPNAVGIKVTAKSPRDGFGLWQASIVANVFGRRSLELGLPPVAFVADNESASGGLDFSPGPVPPLTKAQAEEAVRHVREVAKKNGATTGVRILKPERFAFAVEFQAKDPATFLLHGLEPALKPLEGRPEPGDDGLYIEVLDANGQRVLENGAGFWVRADLASCSPYLSLGGLLTPEPPPCPAK